MKIIIQKIKNHLYRFIFYFSFILIIFTLSPQAIAAAEGGRIGGGSFNSRPITGNNELRSTYRSYGNSYRRSGIGFPFLLPIFGFGGGGIFGLLILIAISRTIVNTIRGSKLLEESNNKSINNSQSLIGSVTIIQLQIGLLASAKKLQEELRDLANSADTSSSIGLAKVLQEASVALLRNPELWVYGNIESGKVPINSAESTFTRISISERSKIGKEITSNFAGEIKNYSPTKNNSIVTNSINELIAITILIAAKSSPLNNAEYIDAEQIRKALEIAGSTPSGELIALEVLWVPEGDKETLSSEELLTTYPNLKHL